MPGAQAVAAHSTSRRDLVFISYSHAHEPPWLGRLRIILKPYVARGRLEVWADPYIQVGDQWRRKIRGALDRTKVAVFLVSPNFLASDFIQNEEVPPLMSAAAAGSVRIFAVPLRFVDVEMTPFAEFQWARDPERPLDETVEEGEPERSRNRALVEVGRKIVETFEAERVWGEDFERRPAPAQPAAVVIPLTTGNQPGRLHGVPDQRPHFLARDELATLRETLLTSASAAVGVTSVGLYGMGGIGKTELAVALCHEEEVRRAFHDGIFWISLGQEPNILRI